MKWIKKHKILVFFLCLLIFLPFFFLFKKNHNPEAKTYSISKGSIMECVYAVGIVKSDKCFQLKTGIAGKINNIFIKEGDFVEKGDKLVCLETLFTAPFSGTITSISYNEGETVFPSHVILKLTDLANRYVSVNLDQKSAFKVAKNQTVKLSFDSLSDQVFEGMVTAIHPDENKFKARIDIPNLPAGILPGMTMDAAIEISQHSDVFLIPVSALENDKIFIKENNKLKTVFVKVEFTDGKMIQISSSQIREGDQLLIKQRAIK